MKRIFVLFGACLLLSGCASGPATAQKAPDWVMDEPKPDATYTYFVADFTDAGGDPGNAKSLAVGKVIDEVVKYMGVKIKAEFVGEQQATLDSYAATMRQTVTSSSEARFVGFTVKDSFVQKPKDRKDKSVTVWVLCAYETAQMDKERDRLQALLREQENAVLVPESAGKAAVSAGRVADAVGYFVQAALGAATVPMDNKEARVQRTLSEATGALSSLRIVKVSGPLSVKLGEAPSSPFVAKVVASEDDAAPGVPGAKLVVAYQRKQASGRLITRSESAVSGPDGTVSYTPPAFDYAGSSAFTVSLDLSSELQALSGVPEAYSALVDSFRAQAAGKAAEFRFSIGSDAKAIPLLVAVADLSPEGAASGTIAQAAVLDSLLREKYSAKASPLSSVAMGDAASAAAAAKAAGAQRAIIGTVGVDSVSKDGGMFTASATAKLSVVDAKTGDLLLQVNRSATAIGATESEARAAAYKVAGMAAAKQIISSL